MKEIKIHILLKYIIIYELCISLFHFISSKDCWLMNKTLGMHNNK